MSRLPEDTRHEATMYSITRHTWYGFMKAGVCCIAAVVAVKGQSTLTPSLFLVYLRTTQPRLFFIF
ncbi:hypothetical protein VFPPC_16051 [Pochonia chlamydosporia 170]|uniref:Uncharacterized protein n=1 Tax=Pochonia chlamydosporia 170 TaxID=1380566 RepID=A0A179FNH9_METCM|nr:hypothetical protein VFPPC_16051 [Pochonia chlamydosporia 170]OAQ66623.1 hypothetical protein VFPPC_16051 [Pochonia chlamydosporia 170]